MPLPRLRVLAPLLSVALACGPGDSKTDGGDSDSATGTSGAPTTGAMSSTEAATTSDTGSAATTVVPTTGDATTGDATTGADVSSFQRFELKFAAGPCPEQSDCDGFIELHASKMLRVEKFGEVGNPVTEVEISEDDFLAAAQIFADPPLIALLDGPDPVCDPPTDIFESMRVIEGGHLHDGSTTGCDEDPVAAARAMAQALAMKYAP